LLVALLYSAKAVVRVVGAQQMGFSSLWCLFVVGAVVGGRNGCALVRVVGGEGFGYAVVAGQVVMLLLTENVEGVL
jgi:hypothetical protein